VKKNINVVFIRINSIADEIIPPLHYGYLAASLPGSCKISLIDMLRDNTNEQHLLKEIESKKFDLICLSSYSKDIANIKSLSGKLKVHSPESIIVLGGVQPSLMPEATMEFVEPGVDFCFTGDGENSLARFVVDTECRNFSHDILRNIPGLVFRLNGEIIKNPSELIEDLDSIPFPRWDIMPPASYPKSPHGAFFRQFPYAATYATRGCPFPCTFCSASKLSGKKVRHRSVENIMEEIKLLNKDYGVKEIHFEDDNFSVKRKLLTEFCETLLKEDLNITWCFPNGLRLEILDMNDLRLMRRAGCYAVNVGVESGSDRILKRMRKGVTTEEMRESISKVKRAGIDIGGFFIIGFPGETNEDILQTIKYSKSLELDRIGVSYFQPYPGTKEYDDLVKCGKFSYDMNLMKLDLHTINYINDNLSKRQLHWLRRRAFIAFYFRWKIFVKLLKEMKNLEHMTFILKRGIRWLTS
jgi:radical SAM superfamily enzyme YgiQ (UPF0313 family)